MVKGTHSDPGDPGFELHLDKGGCFFIMLVTRKRRFLLFFRKKKRKERVTWVWVHNYIELKDSHCSKLSESCTLMLRHRNAWLPAREKA